MAISYAKVAGAGSQPGAATGPGQQGRVAAAATSAPKKTQQNVSNASAGEAVAKLNARMGSSLQAPTANERLLFGANVMIGYKVEVQVKSGCVYEGIFHTMHISDADLSMVLKYAKLSRDPFAKAGSEKETLAEKPIKTLVINSADLVQIVAKDVRFTPEDLAGGDFGFETDSSISRGRGTGFGRELQAWVPDGEDDALLGLEDVGGLGGGKDWDQFAVNRDKFGVQSTFDEHFYTTKIDRDNCAISEAEAARLAREIELGIGGTTNVHLLEERGLLPDDSGDVDEEEKYSSVVRPGERPSTYQPPQREAFPATGYGREARGDKFAPRGGRGGDGPRQQQHQQHQQQGSPYGHHHHHHHGAAPAPPPPPRAPAWGNMGSGVAAVAGRHDGPGAGMPLPAGMPPPPPPSRHPNAPQQQASPSPSPSPSQPIPIKAGSSPTGDSGAAALSSSQGSQPMDIDPLRREANKVRTQLMAETGAVKKERSSLYGTPKGGHILGTSPLINDPTNVRALNLEPGKTPFTPDQQKHFELWKQQEHGAADKKPTTAAALDDLKRFSAGMAARKPGDKAPTGEPGSPSRAAAPGDGASSADASKAASSTPGAEPAKKPSLGLNPNAKPFTLSFSAKPFVPGGAAAAAPAASPAAPPAAPAAAPSAAPAPAPPAPAVAASEPASSGPAAPPAPPPAPAPAADAASHSSAPAPSPAGPGLLSTRDSGPLSSGGMSSGPSGGHGGFHSGASTPNPPMGGRMGGPGGMPPHRDGPRSSLDRRHMDGMHGGPMHGPHSGPMGAGSGHKMMGGGHHGDHHGGPDGAPHMGHKGVPPPPLHGPGPHMDAGMGMGPQPGMAMHAMPPGAMPGPMPPGTPVFMPAMAGFPMNANAMVPGGMPGAVVYQPQPPHMRPGGPSAPQAMVMLSPAPYMQYQGYMPAPATGRPPFGYQGMAPMGMVPMMGSPMAVGPGMPGPLDHPGNRMGGGMGERTPNSVNKGRGPRPDRKEGGGGGGGSGTFHPQDGPHSRQGSSNSAAAPQQPPPQPVQQGQSSGGPPQAPAEQQQQQHD